MYSEIQAFHHWHVRVALAFPPLAVLAIACRQIIWHHPWTSPPLSNGDLIFLTILLLAVYLRLNTVRLVTEIWPAEVRVGLRGLWKRRKISMGEIRTATALSYDPIGDFGGYGFRSGKGGTAYIASGDRAVELVLRNGEKIFIGSQKSDELANMVQELLTGNRA